VAQFSGSRRASFSSGVDGIAKAESAGVYKGRRASIDAATVRETNAQGCARYRLAERLSGAGEWLAAEPTWQPSNQRKL